MSMSLLIFFIIVGILGTAIAVFFSVDGLSGKFFAKFEEDDRVK